MHTQTSHSVKGWSLKYTLRQIYTTQIWNALLYYPLTIEVAVSSVKGISVY